MARGARRTRIVLTGPVSVNVDGWAGQQSRRGLTSWERWAEAEPAAADEAGNLVEGVIGRARTGTDAKHPNPIGARRPDQADRFLRRRHVGHVELRLMSCETRGSHSRYSMVVRASSARQRL